MAVGRESIVVRIDCDPVALFYQGFGPIIIPADDVIPADEMALGAPDLINVPDIEGLINGSAGRYEFTIAGVTDRMTRLALEDAASVRNARVDVGLIKFGASWEILAVEWEAVLEARSLTVSRPQEQNGQVTRSISLTVAHGETQRARAPNAHFTDQDQRRRSSTDAIFSHVGGISSGTTRRFGPND